MKKLFLGALASLTIAACSDGEAVEAPTTPIAELSTGNLRITAEATGTVEPIRAVEVKSQASGEIINLLVDVGDRVEPGDLLAEVDPRDVRTAYNQAKADLDVASARLQISEAQLERSQELFEAGFLTQQELESAQLDFANAQATLVRNEANMELAELRLADVTIRAPSAGTILTKNVELGTVIQSASNNVSGGAALFVMAELEQMQVRTLVDETDMGQLSAGLGASVTVEAYPDRSFRGVVQKIEPQAVVEQNVTMFPVIVTLDNSSGLLKPGMNAEVEVLIDQAMNVLLAPNNAVVTVQDAVPAAMALGIDPETLDMSAMRGGWGGRPGGAGSGRPGGAGGRPEGTARGGSPAGAGGAAQAAGSEAPDEGTGSTAPTGGGATPAGGDMRARIADLRAKVESGEITQDSLRTVMASMRDQAQGRGGAATEVETRPGVVFVMVDGAPEMRMVQLGLSDWDNTQIVSGLEGDEELAVIGAAQLMAQQQEFMNRMRSRMGGSPFGRRR